MYIPQNNLGLDRTFPSLNFVDCRLLILGRIESCSLAAIAVVRGVDQLLAHSLCIRRILDGPSLSGRGECTSLCCSGSAQHGRGWMDGLYTVLYTLHWPHHKCSLCPVSEHSSALAACRAGAALPACVPWAKLSFSSFFFFFFSPFS